MKVEWIRGQAPVSRPSRSRTRPEDHRGHPLSSEGDRLPGPKDTKDTKDNRDNKNTRIVITSSALRSLSSLLSLVSLLLFSAAQAPDGWRPSDSALDRTLE